MTMGREWSAQLTTDSHINDRRSAASRARSFLRLRPSTSGAARRLQRLVRPTADDSLGLRQSQQQTQRLIHGRRIREGRRNFWLQEDDIRTSFIGLVVLPAHALRKVVLGPHFVAIVWLDWLTHSSFAL